MYPGKEGAVDQFINVLGGLLGPQLSTLRTSIGELDDVLVGLGGLALLALIFLIGEIKPAVQRRWHIGAHGGRRTRHGRLHQRH